MARKPRSVQPLAAEAGPVLAGKKRLVIFVHGIRDPSFWSQKLRTLFEAEGFIAVPIGFYVFDIFRFLLGIRRKAVERVKQQIKDAIDSHPGAEVTIIAHSFGTYVVSRILDEDPSLDISRLVMCGGIVRRNYRWDKTVRLNYQGQGRMEVINEHSGRDIWPLFARHATLGFGDSGTIGCQDANVIDRQHDVRHSSYLTEEFAKTYWIPYLARGDVLADPKSEGKTSWIFFLNRSPVTALAAIATVLGVGFTYVALDRITFKTMGTMAYSKDAAGINFQIVGKANRDAPPEPIYAAQVMSPTLEHKLLSTSKYGRIEVTISKRVPIVCNENSLEDTPALAAGTKAEPDPRYQTFYEFDLSNAHHFLGKSEISLKYESPLTVDGKVIDRLTLGAGNGIDPSKIRLVRLIHSGDECLDEAFPTRGRTPFVKVQPLELPEDDVASLFATPAFAQYGQKLTRDDVAKFIRSSDPQVQGLGLDAIRSAPLENGATVKALVVDPSTDPDTLAKLLLAAKSTSQSPIPLDIGRVIKLSVADDNRVRDAARSYLRAPGVVNADVVAKMEASLASDLAPLRAKPVEGKPYAYDYLLLIAARDVYYNLGVQKLEAHLNAVLSGGKGDLKPALQAFEAGRKLRGLAASDRERVSLSKNTYGKALAQYRSAVAAQAASIGGKGAADFIAKARLGAEPLQDRSSIAAFQKLLEEVKNDPSLYPWPAHLDQAKRCIEKLTFACISGGEMAKE
jgi:pimeloyl-ACP methyl ester carboxylesterase